MIYFISYDIANPRRLNKIAKLLENYGIRVQYSFFECEMEKEQLIDLRNKIINEMRLKEDSLKIFPICTDCVKNAFSIGKGNVFIPKTYQIL